MRELLNVLLKEFCLPHNKKIKNLWLASYYQQLILIIFHTVKSDRIHQRCLRSVLGCIEKSLKERMFEKSFVIIFDLTIDISFLLVIFVFKLKPKNQTFSILGLGNILKTSRDVYTTHIYFIIMSPQ